MPRIGIFPLLYVSAATAAALTLCSCGGGGGSQVASVPPPPATPMPTPTPTPTPSAPLPPAQLGLVSSAPFAVLGVGETYSTDASGNDPKSIAGPSAQDVQFSYDAASGSYSISLPGFQAGRLTNPGYNGSAGQVATSTTNGVSVGSSSTLQPLNVWLPVPGSDVSPYTYTSFGTWSGQTGVTTGGGVLRAEGIFAYGIPTQAGDVPVTGTANYTAEVRGSIGPTWMDWLSGTANLSFGFGAGNLSGSLHAGVFDNFDGIVMDFGKYDFTQTVYSTGSTTFSGKFVVPGMPDADSSFSGQFTGPGAAELMARFQAPYLFNGQQGTMSGIWIGKKN